PRRRSGGESLEGDGRRGPGGQGAGGRGRGGEGSRGGGKKIKRWRSLAPPLLSRWVNTTRRFTVNIWGGTGPVGQPPRDGIVIGRRRPGLETTCPAKWLLNGNRTREVRCPHPAAWAGRRCPCCSRWAPTGW